MDNKSYFLHILRTLPKSYQSNYIRNNIIKNCPEIYNSNYYDVSALCRVCGYSYAVQPINQKLLPCKKLNRFLRRINKHSYKCRTPYQMESFEKWKKYISAQKIVKICNNCYHIRKCYVKKILTEIENIPHSPKKIKRAKKMRKIKEFAGLSKNAVLSVKKRKLGSNNADYSVTPKKQKLDEVILLDTPTNSVCSLVDSNNESKSNEFNKNAIKSNPSTSNANTTIINLVTPKSKKCSNLLTSNADTTIINLVSPKSKKSNKKKQKLDEIIPLDTPTNDINQNNVLTKSKKKGKKSNIVLETKQKSAKKEKLNVLQSLINDADITKLNKTSSLQLFLQSIPSY